MAQLLGGLFSGQPQQKQPTPEEMMKANKKSVQRSRRQMDQEVRALERQEKKVEMEVRMLAKQGRNSDARQMAKEIVRIRKQKEQLLKTKVTLGAVQSKTESAKANLAMTKAFTGATRAMTTANAVNSPEKIQRTMTEFERQQQLMQLQEEMLDELLDDSDEEEEAEEVVDAVFDEIGIELNSKLVDAPKTRLAAAQPEKEKPQTARDDADLEALLKSL